ncbi:MAG: GNAT family protein [Patescibacteria group bacterium]|jgi:RimJ/RimL family protein N-acetyltransferase
MIAPVLKGDRMVLKPIELKHAAIRYKWYTDSKVAKYQDFADISLKELKSSIINRRKSKNYFGWMVFTESKVLIGEIQLREIDFDNQTGVLSVNIGETKFWGQGYATEATKLVSEFFFNKLKLNRIELGVISKNIGAIKCYQKCGFKKEGVKKKAHFKNGKFYDSIPMSLIKAEYLKNNDKKYGKRLRNH